MSKKELEDIAEIIPPGTARIGGRQECRVVAHILGKEPKDDEMYIPT